MKKRHITGLFFLALFGGFAGSQIFNYFNKSSLSFQDNQIPAPVKYVNVPSSAPSQVPDFVNAAESSVNAVVHVKSAMEVGGQYIMDPFHLFFYGQPRKSAPQTQTSSGSGVIISEDGYIVTNNHVIRDASKIEIVMNNKKSYEAKVIGTDPGTDIALLKIEEKNLPVVQFGNSDQVRIGEWVLAVGNPFNLNSTVTAGIISAKARNINILEQDPNSGNFPIESFLQTDAAVNPGNSGGALVNTNGELVGINTAIASNTGSYNGYSFAVPANLVKKVAKDLAEFGEVQRAYLGVSIREMDSKLADELKIDLKKGVYVSGLTESGSAEKYGLKIGDIITQINEFEISSVPELQEKVNHHRPGEEINVVVYRNGNKKSIPVILQNKDGNTKLVKRTEVESKDYTNLLGASIEEVSNDEKARLRIPGGVKIKNLKRGKLSSSGVQEGFIITKIDQMSVNTLNDFNNILSKKKGGVLIEGIYPNGVRSYYGLGI